MCVREAIANAVAHRDYDREDVEVRVSIFADRFEVQSPGRLPAPLTLETLGEGYALRNRVIAKLLFNIRYIERWNTGILRMRQLMRQHGLPEPIYQEIGRAQGRLSGAGRPHPRSDPRSGRHRSPHVRVNERQVQALALMVNEGREMSDREYREMFDVTYITAFHDLAALIKTGQVRMIGSGRASR